MQEPGVQISKGLKIQDQTCATLTKDRSKGNNKRAKGQLWTSEVRSVAVPFLCAQRKHEKGNHHCSLIRMHNQGTNPSCGALDHRLLAICVKIRKAERGFSKTGHAYMSLSPRDPLTKTAYVWLPCTTNPKGDIPVRPESRSAKGGREAIPNSNPPT